MIGRHLPTEAQPTPTLYRMTIFAPNVSVAKSRYWYFLRGLKKVKKATGEIVSVKEVRQTKPPGHSSKGRWKEGLDEHRLTRIPAGPREAPPEGQELRHLDPLRLAVRHPQHVQGVP